MAENVQNRKRSIITNNFKKDQETFDAFFSFYKKKIMFICLDFSSKFPLKYSYADFDDVLSVAYLAFYEAFYRYIPSRGASFITYARTCIEYELGKYYKESANPINSLSLDDKSDESGLTYSELIGNDDNEIGNIISEKSILSHRFETSDDIYQFVNKILENGDESLDKVVKEFKQGEALSKKELTNLKRRIKYRLNKRK